MKPVICLLALVILITSLPFASSCSNNTPQESNIFLELLKLLPATAKDDGCFALIDYKTLFESNGLYFPNAINQTIDRMEFMQELLSPKISDKNNPDNYIMMLTAYNSGWGGWVERSSIQKQNIGYDATSVDAEINNLTRPVTGLDPTEKFYSVPELKVAAIGRFNPEATKNALDTHTGWPNWAIDQYSSESYNNITIYNWGDGSKTHLNDRNSPPCLDRQGRAWPLAISSKYLLIGSSISNVKLMIDSSLSNMPTLADVSEYALAANGLHNLGAYVAIIGDEALVNGWGELTNYNTTQPRLMKFLTFGTGYGKDEKGYYIAIVLVHNSSDNANDNVSLLKQRITTTKSNISRKLWTDYIYDTQISTKGNVLLAKLYTNDPLLWNTWFLNRDFLVLHEK